MVSVYLHLTDEEYERTKCKYFNIQKKLLMNCWSIGSQEMVIGTLTKMHEVNRKDSRGEVSQRQELSINSIGPLITVHVILNMQTIALMQAR